MRASPPKDKRHPKTRHPPYSDPTQQKQNKKVPSRANQRKLFWVFQLMGVDLELRSGFKIGLDKLSENRQLLLLNVTKRLPL
jgi:hypothetical protein